MPLSLVCRLASWGPFKLLYPGNSLAVQWLRLGLSLLWTRVRSLVRELRSPKPCGAARTNQPNKILFPLPSAHSPSPVHFPNVCWLQPSFPSPEPTALPHSLSPAWYLLSPDQTLRLGVFPALSSLAAWYP